jgi:hypothetical protein
MLDLFIYSFIARRQRVWEGKGGGGGGIEGGGGRGREGGGREGMDIDSFRFIFSSHQEISRN